MLTLIYVTQPGQNTPTAITDHSCHSQLRWMQRNCQVHAFYTMVSNKLKCHWTAANLPPLVQSFTFYTVLSQTAANIILTKSLWERYTAHD